MTKDRPRFAEVEKGCYNCLKRKLCHSDEKDSDLRQPFYYEDLDITKVFGCRCDTFQIDPEVKKVKVIIKPRFIFR